jgi:protein SCO1/2
MKNWQTVFSCTLVLLFGFTLFYLGTDGFRAFTAEAARVNTLHNDQPAFPDVTLEDSEGRFYSVSEFADKYILITFMYTSCYTVCPQLEMNMADLYELLPSQTIGEDIIFLTISFDPTRDDPATLDKYKDYFNSDGETWRMARIPDQAELDSLLESFGVVVIPDEYGNFAHNSAFYLVDKEGRLVRVMDYTKINEAAHTITDILANGTGADL